MRVPLWRYIGIAHISITSTPIPTIHERKRRFARSVPAHNCSHNIPQPSKGFGSSPQGLVFQPGSLPLTTFVALPSYIPLHYCSPPLSLKSAELHSPTGGPSPGIVGFPLASLFSQRRQFASLRSTHSPVIGWLAQICRVGPMESECAFHSMWKTTMIGHERIIMQNRRFVL